MRQVSDISPATLSRLHADALLLTRATGLRIGELRDLELDCVHQIDGHGTWLKVPLGKLASERMVPLDEETVAVIDRIVARRTPGRPLPHPRTGRPVDFLLVHQGRRLSACALREEQHHGPDFRQRRLADRLHDGQVQAIVSVFEPGTPRWQRAGEYGISVRSVGRLLRQWRTERDEVA